MNKQIVNWGGQNLNKLGFTLVELLGVITVLAMILLIAVPNITRTLQRNSENEYKRFIEELELATETYLSFHKSIYPQISEVGGVALVKMKELIDYGIVDSKLVNPETKELIKENDLMVARKNEDGVLEYTFLVANREDGGITILGIPDITRIEEGESYNFLEGITAVDLENNVVSNITVSVEDSSTLTVGTYELIYIATYDGTSVQKKTKVIVEKTYLFDYTGSYQEFVVPKNGKYVIELWGAQGGKYTKNNANNAGGKGAYTKGTIELKENKSLYVYVGAKGSDGNYTANFNPAVSFNGGGSGGNSTCSLPYSSCHVSPSGGGATDVRYFDTTPATADLTWNSALGLRSRIMIAAGGGGSGYSNLGGAGGAINGIDSVDATPDPSGVRKSTGGTQTSGGSTSLSTNGGTFSKSEDGSFGKGGNSTPLYHPGGGGGGGYYGGGAGGSGGHDTVGAPGSGGSSYISGYPQCNAISKDSTDENIIHTGKSDHYSGYVFKDYEMKAGNEEMPTHDGTSTMTGNSENGYAKIKYIGE